MASKRPSSTAKGLGHRHRLQRERLLRAHIDGTPCDLCGEPMLRQQQLQADHSTPRAIAGVHHLADRLVHASCNASAGARLGNAMRANESHDADRERLAFAWP
jgi:hypothetical protein